MTTIAKNNAFIPIGAYSDDTVIGNDDLIAVVGMGVKLLVRGTNDEVTVTGTSQFAPNGQDDFIVFQPDALTPYGRVVVDAFTASTCEATTSPPRSSATTRSASSAR